MGHPLVSFIVLTCATGCPVVSNLPAPGRVLTQRDPELGREYYLYVPAGYDDQKRWPLVVTCHGTPYWDTARAQLKTWKGLAEQQGFLLAAPDLMGTASAPHSDREQIRRQREDEQAILSIVRSIRGARSVDETRIFLTGWSAGAYAVLFTGLRHPDIFRALSIYQGNFDPALVEPCVPFLDRYQRVQVVYGRQDPIADAEVCIDWLRAHEMEPEVLERAGIHKRGPEPVCAFFAEVVRKHPWIRLRVHDDPLDDMRMRFSTRASFEPVKFRWDFGDGCGSAETTPEHQYDKPGQYVVRVALWASDDRYHIRRVQLRVPRIRIGARPAATAPAP